MWAKGRNCTESREKRIPCIQQKGGKANWICHILRKNGLLKHVIEGKIEGKIEVMGGRGRRCKQLLDDLEVRRGYWKSKVEVIDRNLWRTRFGRGCGIKTGCGMGEWQSDTE